MPATPFTTEPLDAGDPRFVARVPGAAECLRLFPEPASIGRGSLGVEGGITLVGGPGLGKTSLLRRLAAALESERGIACALVALPAPEDSNQGFYRALGALVRGAREGLARSTSMGNARHGELRAAVEREPAWDAGEGAFTPRGLADSIATLGPAATHAGGICLLVDDVDAAAGTSWKAAFVAALRFTFQSASGITPIYAAWKLFLDESLPGSNYFRNVTRPVFLEPFARGGERLRLCESGLPGLADEVREALFSLAGGHPRLLAALLRSITTELSDNSGAAIADKSSRLSPAQLPALLAPHQPVLTALIANLLAGSRQIDATLKQLAARPYLYEKLPKVVVSTGLVDLDETGHAVLPGLIAGHLKSI